MTQDSTPEKISPLTETSDEPIEPTWEDDETPSTLFLRSAFALLAGALLMWTQWNTTRYWAIQSGVDQTIGANWGRWVASNALTNFVLPVGIVWFFFAQGLRHQDWLKDQRHNAWNYGWNFKNWRFHLKIAVGCLLVSFLFLWIFSRNPQIRQDYLAFLPPKNSPADYLWLLSTLTLYMFCWEWFFRGFLLFGMAQGFGAIPAIILQAVVFGLSHAGKPPIEMAGAFAGGLILGALAWREKSFLPAFLIHAFIHVTWAILI